jgi:pimeloyl-ACP methyl ester carboxylesterase
VASFIATEPRSPPPRGVVVSGACARSWYESLETSARRQLLLRGIAPERVERRLAKRRSMLGAWPVGGRSARYHRELEAFDVAARWRRVTCPVRILAAEHDWIVTPQEQTTIESLLSDRSPPHVDRVDLPGLDHVFTRHPSLAASVTQYGAGEPDSGWTEHVTEWLGSP